MNSLVLKNRTVCVPVKKKAKNTMKINDKNLKFWWGLISQTMRSNFKVTELKNAVSNVNLNDNKVINQKYFYFDGQI